MREIHEDLYFLKEENIWIFDGAIFFFHLHMYPDRRTNCSFRFEKKREMRPGLAKLKLHKKGAGCYTLAISPFPFPIELRAEANPPLCKRPEIKAGKWKEEEDSLLSLLAFLRSSRRWYTHSSVKVAASPPVCSQTNICQWKWAAFVCVIRTLYYRDVDVEEGTYIHNRSGGGWVGGGGREVSQSRRRARERPCSNRDPHLCVPPLEIEQRRRASSEMVRNHIIPTNVPWMQNFHIWRPRLQGRVNRGGGEGFEKWGESACDNLPPPPLSIAVSFPPPSVP